MVLRQCLAHVMRLSDADNRNLAARMASIQGAGSTAQVSTFERTGEKVNCHRQHSYAADWIGQVSRPARPIGPDSQRTRTREGACTIIANEIKMPFPLAASLLARPCGDYR
jgi:hypothetical protein